MGAADLTTRGGRVRHIRFALATEYGNVTLQRFGELVADEETRLTGEPVAAYMPSTVKRWEEGAALYLNCALAIASLGKTSAEWVAFGGAKIQRRPTEEQERRTKVIEPEHSDPAHSPVKHRKHNN